MLVVIAARKMVDVVRVQRFLVEFRSEPSAKGTEDVHFVDTYGVSVLEAILTAKQVKPPCFEVWASVRAWPWPKGCPGVVEAAERLTAVRR